MKVRSHNCAFVKHLEEIEANRQSRRYGQQPAIFELLQIQERRAVEGPSVSAGKARCETLGKPATNAAKCRGQRTTQQTVAIHGADSLLVITS
jgi:hypothetical protein